MPIKKVASNMKQAGLSVPVYSLAGRTAGTLSLPKEIFGVKVNKSLLSQALRVYITNQTGHFGNTKTRGRVRGSTAKIYRQKGTGRARHGAKTAPIFVGGGVVFGPKTRKTRLDLPKKMKKAALLAALSEKMIESQIIGVSGLEKATGKTKEMVKLLEQLSKKAKVKGKKSESTLILTGEKIDNVVRGIRNLPGIDVLPADQINAYEVLRHQLLILTKDSITQVRALLIATLQNDKRGK